MSHLYSSIDSYSSIRCRIGVGLVAVGLRVFRCRTVIGSIWRCRGRPIRGVGLWILGRIVGICR